MSHHLEHFAKHHIAGKPDGYLLALWMIYQKRMESGRLSEKIKSSLDAHGLNILKIKVASRARRYLALSEKIVDQPEASSVSQSLGAMRVKNFRGFGSFDNEDKGTYIKFAADKNIFYAPNGGGKTSLCEAIEYVVTGTLKEADRRSTKLLDYIRRGNARHELTFRAKDGSSITSTLSLSPCFIDRNRLHEFALLGSKDTNFKQSDVLAALFGLQGIEELIQRFVQPRSFNLAAQRITAASQERTILENEGARAKERRMNLLSEIEQHKNEVNVILSLRNYEPTHIQMRFGLLNRLLALKENKLREVKADTAPNYLEARTILAFTRLIKIILERYSRIQNELVENVKEVHFEEFVDLHRKLTHLTG